MKRLLVLLFCLVMAVSLLAACTPSSDENTGSAQDTGAGTFRVGFGRVNVTPDLGIGLAGMGDDATRLATSVQTPLYITCIAVTDEKENTVLLMTSDSIRTETWVCDNMRDLISRELNIPRENIISSTTHSHNTPDSIAAGYTPIMINGGLEACKLAMADRKTAEIYTGTTYSDGLNFVRHYVTKEGDIVGPNYGDNKNRTYVGHETEVDNAVQLIQFIRKDAKDIVLMNWRGHPIVSGVNYTAISAGYVGFCRSEMESAMDCHFAYFQGASGNVADESWIDSEENFRSLKEQGQKLAWCAIEYMDQLEPVNTGLVEVKTVKYAGNVRVDSEEYIQAANLFSAAKSVGKSNAEAAIASGNLCFCPQALSCINMRKQAYSQGNGKFELEMAAVSIGDIAFISSPWEMFDNTAKQIKDGSPYEQTFVLYLSNGRGKYLPSEPAYSNGCYEKELSYFVKGTAEEVAGVYTDMLKELYKDGVADPAITTFDSKLPNDT